MKLIEFGGAKGGAVWVNREQVLYVGLRDPGQSSMYGDSNASGSTRLHFANGEHVEVREALADVVARLSA
jgi:hypothetical protein